MTESGGIEHTDINIGIKTAKLRVGETSKSIGGHIWKVIKWEPEQIFKGIASIWNNTIGKLIESRGKSVVLVLDKLDVERIVDKGHQDPSAAKTGQIFQKNKLQSSISQPVESQKLEQEKMKLEQEKVQVKIKAAEQMKADKESFKKASLLYGEAYKIKDKNPEQAKKHLKQAKAKLANVVNENVVMSTDRKTTSKILSGNIEKFMRVLEKPKKKQVEKSKASKKVIPKLLGLVDVDTKKAITGLRGLISTYEGKTANLEKVLGKTFKKLGNETENLKNVQLALENFEQGVDFLKGDSPDIAKAKTAFLFASQMFENYKSGASAGKEIDALVKTLQAKTNLIKNSL